VLINCPSSPPQSLLHTLAPGHEDMSAFKAHGSEALATREAATVAALRVVNAVMRLDGRFLADTAQAMGVERYVRARARVLGLGRGCGSRPARLCAGSRPACLCAGVCIWWQALVRSRCGA